MVHRQLLSLSLLTLTLACSEQGDPNAPPPGGSGTPNSTTGATASGGGSTSGGSATSTTGGPTCSVDCPDDGTGTCPGHAEWSRNILVWGVWQSNDSNGNPSGSISLSPGGDDDVECTGSIGVCLAYEDPDQVPAVASELLADQIELCQDLTPTELAAIGLDDIPVGSNGWSLVHHFCTAGPLEGASYMGQNFGTVPVPSSQSSCVGGAWNHEGSCSAAACPLDTGGSSSSGGGADGSTSTGSAAYDCTEVDASNVSYTTTSSSRFLIERDAVIRRPLADVLADEPYTALYMCGDANISPSNHEIWGMGSTSILAHLGLANHDEIVDVAGETKAGDMYDAMSQAFLHGGSFGVTVKRGTTTLKYDVDVVAP